MLLKVKFPVAWNSCIISSIIAFKNAEKFFYCKRHVRKILLFKIYPITSQITMTNVIENKCSRRGYFSISSPIPLACLGQNLEYNTSFFLVFIKYTPVSSTVAAIIDCRVICSFKKYQPSNSAIIGLT